MPKRRSLRTVAGVLVLCLIVLVPWRTRIDIPVVVRPMNYSHLHAPMSGQITQIYVKSGHRVARGDVLFELENPEIPEQQRIVESELRALNWQLGRHHLAGDLRRNLQVLKRQKQISEAKQRSLHEQAQRLWIVAPFDGVVYDLDESLQPGCWVDADRVLAYLADMTQFVGEGYVQEKHLERLKLRAGGMLYTESTHGQKYPVTIQSIDQTQSVILPQSYLASVFGGPVAVREQDGQLIPEISIYRVLLALDDDKLRPEQVYRGEAQVQGERESLLYSAYRAVASVFVRESGF